MWGSFRNDSVNVFIGQVDFISYFSFEFQKWKMGKDCIDFKVMFKLYLFFSIPNFDLLIEKGIFYI